MKPKNAFAGVVLITLVVLVGFLFYMGFFNGMRVSENMIGPYTYVYESYTGAYKDTGKVFEKVFKSLAKDGIKISKSIGIYYDDPKKVASNMLRSDCGAILEEKDFSKLPKLLETYTIKTLPAKKRAVTEFPYRNFLSYVIGPMKAYPKLAKYAAQKKYVMTKAIEVYDPAAKKIYYILESSN